MKTAIAAVLTVTGIVAFTFVATAQEKSHQPEPVTMKEEENPWEIAWGKMVRGLRVGISFRHFEEPVWHFKEAASFIVYVKNVTRKPITIEYPESLFDDCLPTVLDKNGKNQSTMKGGAEASGRPQEPQFLKRELAGGETIEIGHPWFKVFSDGCGENEEREGNVAPSLTVSPGKFRASYTGLKIRRSGQTGYEEGLSTGEIEFKVKALEKR
jgi:hypothetical protein